MHAPVLAASADATLRVLEEEPRARLVPEPPRGLDPVRYAAGRLEAGRGAVPAGVLGDAAGVGGDFTGIRHRRIRP